jgi:tRNA-2-methylthio-N6-dimethylallyladenosine synthase
VVQERYDRLVALVEETTYAENRKLAGTTIEVLVAEGEGRKDAATHRMSGRARDNRLVHFTPHPPSQAPAPRAPSQTPAPQTPAPQTPGPQTPGPQTPGPRAPDAPRPGDIVTVTVTRAAPHYLLSDAPPLSLRRTRAGDAWEAAAAAPARTAPAPSATGPAPAPATSSAEAPVLLGMPALGPSVG